jgi:hypothetical protein
MEGIFVILWKGDIAKIENIEGDIAKRMVVSFQKKKKITIIESPLPLPLGANYLLKKKKNYHDSYIGQKWVGMPLA